MRQVKGTLLFVLAAALVLGGCANSGSPVEPTVRTEPAERPDEIGGPVLSADGGSLAFAAKSGDKWFVMKDGVAVGEEYDQVGDPVLSDDGRSVAFAARSGREWFVIKDGARVVYKNEPNPVKS